MKNILLLLIFCTAITAPINAVRFTDKAEAYENDEIKKAILKKRQTKKVKRKEERKKLDSLTNTMKKLTIVSTVEKLAKQLGKL